MKKGYPVYQIRFGVLYGRLVREFNIVRDEEYSAEERRFSRERCQYLLEEIASLMRRGNMKTKAIYGDISSMVFIQTYIELSRLSGKEEVI